MKKVWEKPKLVGLYRGRSQEAILFCCKERGGNVAASATYHEECKVPVTCDCCDNADCTQSLFVIFAERTGFFMDPSSCELDYVKIYF